MELKLSNTEVLTVLEHTVGIAKILAEASENAQAEQKKREAREAEIDLIFEDMHFNEPFEPEPKTESQSAAKEYYDCDSRQREEAMSRLCGRWIAGGNRCGIEISRAGEHFILTYLKRNGSPTDERYILIWNCGDILYYGFSDRLTVVALNSESDTLMISPGVDYTREVNSKK